MPPSQPLVGSRDHWGALTCGVLSAHAHTCMFPFLLLQGHHQIGHIPS